MSKIVAGHPCYSQTTYSLMLTDTELRSLKPKDAVYRVADSQGLHRSASIGLKDLALSIPFRCESQHAEFGRVPGRHACPSPQ